MPTDKHYFIEKTKNGRYTVQAKGSRQASAASNNQEEAIASVKELNPNDHSDVERVGNVESGGLTRGGLAMSLARSGSEMGEQRLRIFIAIVILIVGTAICIWLLYSKTMSVSLRSERASYLVYTGSQSADP
jgi:hypothetical protein